MLVSMAGGLYPLGRAEALRGLAVVLEKADASGGAARGVVECCYGCAAELMRDDDEDVRLAVVRLVRRLSFWLIFVRLFGLKLCYNLRDRGNILCAMDRYAYVPKIWRRDWMLMLPAMLTK